MKRKQSGWLVRAVGAPPPIASRGEASTNNIAHARGINALIARSTARDRLGVGAMASRKRGKKRERVHRSAAQWLARLKGGEGKSALHLPPDFVLWVFAGLLAHLDRRGDTHVADLAEGALVHGGGLSVHDGTRWQSAGPAHEAALRAIAQAFADLDLTHGRRPDRGAWEVLDEVEAAFAGFW